MDHMQNVSLQNFHKGWSSWKLISISKENLTHAETS